MKKILLALDASEPARRALETAADLARAFGAELAVVSVVPADLAEDEEAMLRSRILHDARHFLADRGVDAEVLEPAGDAANRIEQITAEGGFDTVVMGGCWRAAVALTVGGSVAEHVANTVQAIVVLAN